MSRFLRYLRYKVHQHREIIEGIICLILSPILTVIVLFVLFFDWVRALRDEYRSFEER